MRHVRSAVDSNVLLDVFGPSPKFGPGSRITLDRALGQGALVACEVVWAEVRAHFPDQGRFERAMALLGVEFDSCEAATASVAGESFRAYRAGGGMRTVLVPDFLVAAHASRQADRLITRDRGFLRSAFSGLVVLDPTEA
jgi:predicted nucleic acid-binding protein